MTRLAVAAPSPVAAKAAAAMASRGGNAVDAAVAAVLVAMVTEPGVCAPGAGGFLTVTHPDGLSRVYDGYMAVPGLGDHPADPEAIWPASMDYGGGIVTMVGPASVAVPGAWAALGASHGDHGRLSWSAVLEPSLEAARSGFPLGPSSAYYLTYSHDAVFGHDPASRALLSPGGRPPGEGDLIVQPDLARTLETIASEGADSVYRGEVAEMISDDLVARGGSLSREDLAAYRVEIRTPLELDLHGWSVATNPAPAVGGAAMAAMLAEMDLDRSPQRLASIQERIFRWRRSVADRSANRPAEVARLLASLPGDPIRSGSTVHVSVVDEAGSAVAVTVSAGYGSGVIPTGTGMWMNNALGEVELVGDGSHLEAGGRLNSNMAPTVAGDGQGRVLAVGSPGADRITTAISQVLAAVIRDGLSLEEAVARPRLHVDVGDSVTIAVEPGIDTDGLDRPVRRFDRPHMYFGGVGAAMRHPDGSLEAVADPRRSGCALVTDE
jgi:gamma-glutamyltranspeptidase/glutathione hydrolase